jgi:hypothetical protein
MPRRRQRDTGTSHMPSQRDLRVGERVWLVTPEAEAFSARREGA